MTLKKKATQRGSKVLSHTTDIVDSLFTARIAILSHIKNSIFFYLDITHMHGLFVTQPNMCDQFCVDFQFHLSSVFIFSDLEGMITI